jgi:flavin reductase (DIM6/NTAB) family NADH-FMN oxidoreductase RutF
MVSPPAVRCWGDALAFLGCRVAQRMECPDHWIIYAVVAEGTVAESEASTAVHYCRVGNY